MTLFAHFTPAELPGTLAVLLLGLSIGALIMIRRSAARSMTIVVASLIAFAFLGYLGDVRGWPEGVRLAIDLVFLAAAGILFSLVLREARRQT